MDKLSEKFRGKLDYKNIQAIETLNFLYIFSLL